MASSGSIRFEEPPTFKTKMSGLCPLYIWDWAAFNILDLFKSPLVEDGNPNGHLEAPWHRTASTYLDKI